MSNDIGSTHKSGSALPKEHIPLTESEEHTWSMLAHLSIIINLFTGILGPVVAFVIYLVYRDRSRYVSYHALQSFILQLITWVGGGIIIATSWIITGILSAVIIGICLIPISLLISLIPVAAVVYGIIGGIKCNQEEDFKYWLIGDWVRSTLE